MTGWGVWWCCTMTDLDHTAPLPRPLWRRGATAAQCAPTSVTRLRAPDSPLDGDGGPDTCGTMCWVMVLSGTT